MHRWTYRTWLVGFGVLMTIIGTTITVGAQTARAQTDHPHRIVSLTSGHNDFRNAMSGVAGDADWAVYEQLANTDIDTDYFEFGDTARDRLYALDTQGVTHRLSFSATDQALQTTYLGRWSLVDDMLTLSSGSTSPVHWWNLADGTHGEGGTPDGYVFGSSPDGWVSASDGKIVDQPATGGAEVVLGSPAGLSSFPDETSSVGDDGYVVDASAGLLFSPWGPTSSYTTLAVPAADMLGGCGEEAYQAVVCWGLNSNSHEVVLRMPTDGAAAVSTKLGSVDPEFSFALSADTTAWADEVDDGVRLDSVPADGGAISTSTYSLVQIFGSSFGRGPIGARGSFLVATGPPARRSIGQTSSATTTPTEGALGTRATIHVGTGGLALTPRRVVYADDNHSANFADVYWRKLSAKRGLTVGKSHLVLQRRHASLQGLAASDSTIAVTTGANKPHSPEQLEVFNHGKMYSKQFDDSQSAVVDGHNVIYNQDLFFHELDARTGKTHKLPARAGESPDFTAVDHHLVYRHKRQVWEYPLRGGKPHRLLSLAGVEDLDTSFFIASGDRVALDYTTGGDVDDNNKGATVHVLYRSLDRMHKPAVVPGAIPPHCSVIAITSKAIDCSVPGKVVALSLRTGHRHPVFAPPNPATGGQGKIVGISVLGGRVTWESAAGTGEVALLPAR